MENNYNRDVLRETTSEIISDHKGSE